MNCNDESFSKQLDALLQHPAAVTVEEAERRLATFMHEASSRMSRNKPFIKADGTLQSVSYTCGFKQCNFRLVARRSAEGWRVGLGEKGVRKHTGHVLEAPKRTGTVVAQQVERLIQDARADGATGSDLINHVQVALPR
jgi:hypothetical protein